MPVSILLLASLLTPVAYGFGPDTKLAYSFDVKFNGFLPIMGGNQGEAKVHMDVAVTGKAAEDGKLKAASEIQQFEVEFNGAKLPFGVDNVTEYFPKTNITLDPTGKILTSDAPDKKLPVRLPGLDVKHFPDITYVPIELPNDGIEVGKEWKFSRDFGGAPIEYQCKAESVDGNNWIFAVKLKQSYTVYESPQFEVVAKKEDAVNETTTTMTGDGHVTFDSSAGKVIKATMTNTAVSDAKDLTTGEVKQRKLTTDYSISLKDKPASNRAINPAPTGSLWEQSVGWANQAVQIGRNAFAWLQMASMFGLKALPRELEAWVQPFKSSLRRWAPWLGT